MEASMKRHSEAEIGTKLRQAQRLLAHGQSQAQACKELGVSVMTYHRWRKLDRTKIRDDPSETGTNVLVGEAVGQSDIAIEKQIDEIRTENERLRRIVTDLLLEKVKAQEQVAAGVSSNARSASHRTNWT
jgi:putative transposase